MRKIKKKKNNAEVVDLLKLIPRQQVEVIVQAFEMYYENLVQYIADCNSLDEVKEALFKLPASEIIEAITEQDFIQVTAINDDVRKEEGDAIYLDMGDKDGRFNYLKMASWLKANRALEGVQ